MDIKPKKPVYTLTAEDVKAIKSAALPHFYNNLPRNLNLEELQTLLICKGFINFLGYNKIKISVDFEYDWES
jgi:hypothetical protein